MLLLAGFSGVRTQTEAVKRESDCACVAAERALSRTAPLELDRIGGGELLWKTDRGLVPLPLLDVDVEISVTGIMSRGRLVQEFHNPTGEVVEALYVFPLPEGAAVHAMEIRVGDRRIVSVVQEKQEARRTYEQAKSSGRKAALVYQRRPNLFTTEVANVNPGETVAVALEYIEEASYEDGRFNLRFPLTFTPRFIPNAGEGDGVLLAAVPSESGDDCPSESAAPFVDARHGEVPRAKIRVRLQPGFELQELASGSHEVEVTEADGFLEVVTNPRPVPADRDFRLDWRPALGREPRAAAFVEERDGARYALIMLVPPIPGSEAGLGLPTETLFIIDVSGSMAGPSIQQAREAVLASLDRLRPEDRFNILKFNDENEPFREQFQQAEPTALAEARRWVHGLHANGGTMIHPALLRGLRMMGDSRSAHAQRIVFLTDGAVGNEQEVLRSIASSLGETRLHTIGIGQAPNAYLMRKMALLGRGMCEFVSDSREAGDRVEAFFARLDRPVMTDIDWTAEGLRIEEAHPRRLADLHAGQPLFLSARLEGDGSTGTLSLRGYTRAGPIGMETSIDESTLLGSGIALRWARAKVGSLMDSLHEGADPRGVRAEVVEVGLAFNLVTAYTSLVAVDDRPSALGVPQEMRIASALPRGGTDSPLRRLLGWSLVVTGLLLLLFALPLKSR
jgi:Ca-activated chloride channel family protein